MELECHPYWRSRGGGVKQLLGALGHLQNTQSGRDAKIRLCCFCRGMLKSWGMLPGHGEGAGNLIPFGGATGTAAPWLCSSAGTAFATFPRLVLLKIGRSEFLLDAVV